MDLVVESDDSELQGILPQDSVEEVEHVTYSTSGSEIDRCSGSPKDLKARTKRKRKKSPKAGKKKRKKRNRETSSQQSDLGKSLENRRPHPSTYDRISKSSGLKTDLDFQNQTTRSRGVPERAKSLKRPRKPFSSMREKKKSSHKLQPKLPIPPENSQVDSDDDKIEIDGADDSVLDDEQGQPKSTSIPPVASPLESKRNRTKVAQPSKPNSNVPDKTMLESKKCKFRKLELTPGDKDEPTPGATAIASSTKPSSSQDVKKETRKLELNEKLLSNTSNPNPTPLADSPQKNQNELTLGDEDEPTPGATAFASSTKPSSSQDVTKETRKLELNEKPLSNISNPNPTLLADSQKKTQKRVLSLQNYISKTTLDANALGRGHAEPTPSGSVDHSVSTNAGSRPATSMDSSRNLLMKKAKPPLPYLLNFAPKPNMPGKSPYFPRMPPRPVSNPFLPDSLSERDLFYSRRETSQPMPLPYPNPSFAPIYYEPQHFHHWRQKSTRTELNQVPATNCSEMQHEPKPNFQSHASLDPQLDMKRVCNSPPEHSSLTLAPNSDPCSCDDAKTDPKPDEPISAYPGSKGPRYDKARPLSASPSSRSSRAVPIEQREFRSSVTQIKGEKGLVAVPDKAEALEVQVPAFAPETSRPQSNSTPVESSSKLTEATRYSTISGKSVEAKPRKSSNPKATSTNSDQVYESHVAKPKPIEIVKSEELVNTKTSNPKTDNPHKLSTTRETKPTLHEAPKPEDVVVTKTSNRKFATSNPDQIPKHKLEDAKPPKSGANVSIVKESTGGSQDKFTAKLDFKFEERKSDQTTKPTAENKFVTKKSNGNSNANVNGRPEKGTYSSCVSIAKPLDRNSKTKTKRNSSPPQLNGNTISLTAAISSKSESTVISLGGLGGVKLRTGTVSLKGSLKPSKTNYQPITNTNATQRTPKTKETTEKLDFGTNQSRKRGRCKQVPLPSKKNNKRKQVQQPITNTNAKQRTPKTKETTKKLNSRTNQNRKDRESRMSKQFPPPSKKNNKRKQFQQSNAKGKAAKRSLDSSGPGKPQKTYSKSVNTREVTLKSAPRKVNTDSSTKKPVLGISKTANTKSDNGPQGVPATPIFGRLFSSALGGLKRK